ncbi:MAG: hypothetical protein IPL75_15525 [Acidobacteria bacterium]|nr:hypothetical protein [Acidobacteriota bacterium]
MTTTPLLDVTGLQKSFLSPEGESTLIVDVPQFQLAEESRWPSAAPVVPAKPHS